MNLEQSPSGFNSTSSQSFLHRRWRRISVLGLLILGIVTLYFLSNRLPSFQYWYSALFPPTVQYQNTSIGFSVQYPLTWGYEEQKMNSVPYAFKFAPTQRWPPGSSISIPQQNFIWLIIFPNSMPTSDLPANIKSTSMLDVLNYMNEKYSGEAFPSDAQSRMFQLGNYPAASKLYKVTSDGNTWIINITIALHKDRYSYFMSICLQEYWMIYKYQINAILNSVNYSDPSKQSG